LSLLLFHLKIETWCTWLLKFLQELCRIPARRKNHRSIQRWFFFLRIEAELFDRLRCAVVQCLIDDYLRPAIHLLGQAALLGAKFSLLRA
jgi:hypothetical protein